MIGDDDNWTTLRNTRKFVLRRNKTKPIPLGHHFPEIATPVDLFVIAERHLDQTRTPG